MFVEALSNYTIDQRHARAVGFGSLGMTDKYYKDGYWYKKNLRGYEGKSEAICSMILDNSSLAEAIPYARYEECLINGQPGCRSKNFLGKGENLITFQRIYDLAYGGDLALKVNSYSDLSDRVAYVVNMMGEYTGLDVTDYLHDSLYFDALTLDVDRHFFNLAVIQSQDGFKRAPMFDFGASFFSMQHVFKPEMSLTEKLSIMQPKPFDSDFLTQADFFGPAHISLNYAKIEKKLQKEPVEIADIVKYRLDVCSHLFPDISGEKMMQEDLEDIEM